MPKTAIDYPVTWGYLEQGTIEGQTYTHRGLDRAMPIGVPIVIDGVTIGYSGNTGLSKGPHLHTQAGRDAATQNTINPAPYEFKGGVVTALRAVDEKSWGRYVTIRTDSGVYITYAHLESVNVTVGQRIKKGEEMITKELLIWLHGAFFGAHPSKADFDNWVGKNELSNLVYQCEVDQRRKHYYNGIQNMKKENTKLKKQLKNCGNKPKVLPRGDYRVE